MGNGGVRTTLHVLDLGNGDEWTVPPVLFPLDTKLGVTRVGLDIIVMKKTETSSVSYCPISDFFLSCECLTKINCHTFCVFLPRISWQQVYMKHCYWSTESVMYATFSLLSWPLVGIMMH
jgi:hypothetical protein